MLVFAGFRAALRFQKLQVAIYRDSLSIFFYSVRNETELLLETSARTLNRIRYV